jgi:hypothetical protein
MLEPLPQPRDSSTIDDDGDYEGDMCVDWEESSLPWETQSDGNSIISEVSMVPLCQWEFSHWIQAFLA